MKDKKKVLITGGEGFAGCHLINNLIEKDDYIIYSTYHHLIINEVKNERVVYTRIDICNKESVEKYLIEIKPDYIYHLAGISYVPMSFDDPYKTYETNLIGTLNIYEALRKNKMFPSILFVSSSEVYGQINENDCPIDEDYRLRPQNPYAVSKAAGEMLSYQYFKNYGFNIKIVRPFNHIGTHQSENFVVPSFAKQIVDIKKKVREPIIYVGNLDAIRDFSDARDTVQAYRIICESNKNGEIYNIASSNGIKIREILNTLVRLSGENIKIEIDQSKLRPSDNPIIVGSTEKVRRDLGWKPQFKIENTLSYILEELNSK